MYKNLSILFVIVALLLFALPVQAQTTVVSNGGDSGPGTLRDAVAATAPGGIINLDVARVDLLTQLTINKDLTINGQNPNGTFIVQTGTNQRVLAINGDVTLNDVAVTDGNLTSGNGGGILHSGGTLTLNRVTVAENTIADNGAGIHSNSSLVINQSSILGNTASPATGDGGGIFVDSAGTLNMSDSIVHGNSVGTNAGGIYFRGTSGTIQNSLISGNLASGTGGGVFVDNLLSIQGSAVSGNESTSGGAGVGGGPYDIDNTIFIDNVSAGSGGGLSFAGSGTTLDNSLISNNTALDGGGMFITGDAVVTNTRIVGNTATGSGSTNGGGGFFNRGTVTLVNTVISGNDAAGSNGGGINHRVGDLTLVNVTVAGNAAAGVGGGYWQRTDSGPATSSDIQNSIIYGNTAVGGGDNIFLQSGVTAVASHSLYTINGAFNSTTDVIDSPTGTPEDVFLTVTIPLDLRLEFGSEAIDAGDDALFAALTSPPTTDLIGTPRELDVVTVSNTGSDTGGVTAGAVIDMGAYEMGDCVLVNNTTGLQENTGAPTAYTVNVNCGTSDFGALGGVFGIQVNLDDLDTGDYSLQNSSNPWTSTQLADLDNVDSTNPIEAVNALNGTTNELEYGVAFTAPQLAVNVPGALAGVGYNTAVIENDRYEGDAEPVQTITCELFNLSDTISAPLNGSCSGLTYEIEDLLEGGLDTVIRLESDGDLTLPGQFNNVTFDLLSDPDDSNPDTSFDSGSATSVADEGNIILPTVGDFFDINEGESPLGLLISADGHVPCVALNNASGYPMLDADDSNVLVGFAELVAGDTDGNFVINGLDSQAIVGEFGNLDDTSAPEIADINGDGSINVLDLVHVGRNFGEDYSASGGNDNLPDCGPLHLYIDVP